MVYSNNFNQVRIGVRNGVVTQVVNAVDADATAFIVAAGITDLTQAAAISTFVNDLKTYGIWSKMKALYPFVGGSSTSHKFNLKDPRDLDAAYRLVFNGGWVHSSTGAKPNGTTGYADTKLAPNVMDQNSIHASFYSRTDISGYYWDLGAYNAGGGVVIGPRYQNGSSYVYMNVKSNDSAIDNNPTIGLYMGNRTSSTTNTLFRNGVIIVNGTKSSFAPISLNIYLGADNEGTPIGYSPREQAFASIGDGLSDTEAANFYTSVQKFQTTLGRQVGAPYVSDSDAQSFLNAAVITDITQASAINTLVTDLKTAGVWTKMKAIYPFVGGSATSHKFNLKDPRDLDAAYRLVFNGGWTHASTGATPNGSNGYADTKLSPSAVLTQWNTHMSFYSRTATRQSTVSIDMGSADGMANNILCLTLPRASGIAGSCQYSQTNASEMANITGLTDASGLWLTTRTSNVGSSHKFIRNGSILANATTSAGSLVSNNIQIGCLNTNYFSNKEVAFSSIGDGLTDSESTSFYNAVQKYQITLSRQVGSPIVSDLDAQTFLNAAGITDATQASAVNTLVTDLKLAGIWTKMKAIYPFVGGTATTHKFNLKDPRDLDAAFRLVFNGGWTHASTGAKPNGTTGYADTKFTPSTNLTANSAHQSFYLRTNISISHNAVYGCYTTFGTNNFLLYPYSFGIGWISDILDNSLSRIVSNSGDSTGYIISTRSSSNSHKMFRNGVQIASTTNATNGNYPTINYYLGAGNQNGTPGTYDSNEHAFASIGDGLTDSESSAFYSAVQKFNTTLGRKIGSPIVSDSDAQAFLNAATITDLGQATAVNTLVTDLKAAGVWTKMKAVYPFVGGNATSHKFNLKDPRDLDVAFRLVFNGGWTHSSTGALPNGTNGYADTKMNANSINFDYQSMSATFYSRTNSNSSVNDIAVQTGPNKRFIEVNLRDGNLSYMTLSHNGTTYLTYSNSDSRGFYHSNRIDSTTIKLYKNGTNVATSNQTSSNIYGEYSVFISAMNASANNNGTLYYSNREVAFVSLGSGLTDTEDSAFYTAVQKFQTSLGRQIGTPVLESGQTANLLDTYSSAAAAYSLRKLRTGYYGFAIRVRRSSDNLEQDISFKADGTLDNASLLAFVGSGNGFVTTWYDQSGNSRDVTQTTSDNQPRIVSGGAIDVLANKPSIYFDGSNDCLDRTDAGMPTLGTTVLHISKYNSSSVGQAFVVNWGQGSAAKAFYNMYFNTGLGLSNYGESFSASGRLNVNNLTVITKPNAVGYQTWKMYINSTNTSSGSINSQTALLNSSGGFRIGRVNPSQANTYPMLGYISELVVWPSDMDSQRNSLESSVNSYYSVY